ncbi:hypothetical protein [Pseudodesulfovibrio senegalensis]|uniref:hypothetical protein n=1 Tax=Pseudodesulfovibrio senegalensis TaxID=1721087 RepID=UPI001F4FDE94|nr:hypothetical protein [Pseudodesulfovibrio senegalensis]
MDTYFIHSYAHTGHFLAHPVQFFFAITNIPTTPLAIINNFAQRIQNIVNIAIKTCCAIGQPPNPISGIIHSHGQLTTVCAPLPPCHQKTECANRHAQDPGQAP